MKIGDILTMPDGEQRRITWIDGERCGFEYVAMDWLKDEDWSMDTSQAESALEDAGEAGEE